MVLGAWSNSNSLVDTHKGGELKKMEAYFDLLTSVVNDDVLAGVILFIVLGVAGLWLVIEWTLQQWPIVLSLGSILGLGIFHLTRGLVDRVLKACRGR